MANSVHERRAGIAEGDPMRAKSLIVTSVVAIILCCGATISSAGETTDRPPTVDDCVMFADIAQMGVTSGMNERSVEIGCAAGSRDHCEKGVQLALQGVELGRKGIAMFERDCSSFRKDARLAPTFRALGQLKSTLDERERRVKAIMNRTR
jgi:hypothetical protein